MKKGIIFDMDGTLWDSAANVAESWNLAIKQDGSVDKKLTEQDIQGVMGKTMDVIADILFPELEKEARMKLLDQCCSRAWWSFVSKIGGDTFCTERKVSALHRE